MAKKIRYFGEFPFEPVSRELPPDEQIAQEESEDSLEDIESVLGSSDNAAVRKAMAALADQRSDSYRAVLAKTFPKEASDSFEAVAKELGVSRSTAHDWYHQGIEWLAEYLERDE